MYEKFFGLAEAPFGLTPDTDFFYANTDHQEALNTLLVALQMGEGFIKVSGEVGTGKTLVCRKLLNELGENERFVSAYIPNPTVTPAGLLHSIMAELGQQTPYNMSPARSLELLTDCLIDQKKRNHQVVLVIDEAQALSSQSLETVRLLTNLETEKAKLLQVVLFGQPELDERLAEKKLRQLRQRITFTHHLGPMQPQVVAGYLQHRLRVAGYNGPELFTAAFALQLHKASGGIPRLLNILAHKCLLAAFGEGEKQLKHRHLLSAVADTESADRSAAGTSVIARWIGAVAASAAAVGLYMTAGLG